MLIAKARGAQHSLSLPNGRNDIAASARRLIGNEPNIYVAEGSLGFRFQRFIDGVETREGMGRYCRRTSAGLRNL